MECYEAEELINGYINRTLKAKELEGFLDHVRRCPSCYDELETYFIVNEALNQLSEDQETALDFQMLLDQDLKKESWHLIWIRMQHVLAVFAMLLLAIVGAGLILYKLTG